jgi:hypothetical protein
MCAQIQGKQNTHLLSNFGLVFQWHVYHSLSACWWGGGHQVGQKRGAGENYGMKAVCMLEDVLDVRMGKRSRTVWRTSETH